MQAGSNKILLTLCNFLYRLYMIYRDICRGSMSRRCDIWLNKGVMSGNNVSHSNRRTRRKFLPNLHNYSLCSELLGKKFSLKLCRTAMRTIDKYGGIDSFLLKIKAKRLTDFGQKLRRLAFKRTASDTSSTVSSV